MKIFTSVYFKKENGFSDNALLQFTQDLIIKANKRYFPVRDFEKEVSMYSCGSTTEIVWYTFSNEKALDKESSLENNYIEYLDVLGSINLPTNSILAGKYFNLERIRTSTGKFSLVKIDNDSLEFLTDAVGSNTAFYAETDLYYIVSTSSRITHYIQQVISYPNNTFYPIYDFNSIRNFTLQGHYDHISSTFVDVKCIPLNSRLILNKYGLRIESFETQMHDKRISTDIEYNLIVEELADAIREACLPLTTLSEVAFPISGGRDSRLVAAALYKVGLKNVKCATSGYDGHPDVIIGKQIAETLGWTHETRKPGETPDILSFEDPLSRVSRVLDVHDLQTSAWDDIEDYGAFIDRPVLSGVGGELLRGGYMATKKTAVNSSEATTIINNLLNGGSFITIEPPISTIIYTKSILEMAQINPMLALDYLYLSNRNFRWVNARRRGLNFRRIGIEPLLDNKVVGLSRKIDINTKWEERLFFDIISSLSPELKNLPIEGSRWRFESDAPFACKVRNYEEGWSHRKPLVMEHKASSFDYRRLIDDSFRKEMYSMVLDSNNELTQLGIDRKSLEKYLGNDAPKYPTVVWHLLTAIQLINNSWVIPNRGVKSLSRTMKVPL